MPSALSSHPYAAAGTDLGSEFSAHELVNAVPQTTANRKTTDVYDVDGKQDSGFVAQDPKPQKKQFWEAGRDVYANQGAVGQTDVFEHAS